MDNLIYFYAGFPESFTQTTEKLNPVAEQKLTDLKAGVYLIKQDKLNTLVNRFLESPKDIHIVRGLSFPDIFEKLLKKEISLFDIQVPNYLFIYSIGSELSVNKDYAGAILNYFADKVKMNKSFLFLSGVTKTDLNQYYKIKFDIQPLNI